MNRIIEDILHLSTISRNKVNWRVVEMSKMALSVIDELRQSFPDRTVHVKISKNISAYADERLMHLILSNLLTNAWKFTSKKNPAEIEFGVSEEQGQTVYYVKDNGAGFDQNLAQQMFLPFHRLHKEADFEGTGIGLAIVERAIARLDGKIRAEGKVNEGASFFFTLNHEDLGA